MSLASTRLPKPKNWQDFENSTRVLIAGWLKDPNTQQNGRRGQKQNGVDVWGSRSPGKIVGVQCKEKFENSVTESELRAEVGKAKSFKPKLSEFILVTTAPRDKDIQEVARTITQELSTTKFPFHVSVWGWEDVEERASEDDDAWKAFDPTFNPFAERAHVDLAQRLDRIELALSRGSQTQSESREISLSHSEGDENTPRHTAIETYRRLVENGHARVALASLEALRHDEWDRATASERYRLLVAIASANLALDHRSAAGRVLLEASNEYPERKNSKLNRAKAHLLLRHDEQAAVVLTEILEEDPQNAEAAGLLIQARIGNVAWMEPLDGIHPEIREAQEVLEAQCFFFRSRDAAQWIALSREGAMRYPESQQLKVLAAESVIQQVCADETIRAGGTSALLSDEQLLQAAEVLFIEAKKAIASEASIPSSLAHNAALALRIVERLDDAIHVLDAALKAHPGDQPLLLQRAILAYVTDDAERVLSLLEESPTDPELRVILANAFTDAGRPDVSGQLVDSIDLSGVPEHVRDGVIALRSKNQLKRNDYEGAVKTVEDAIASYGDSISLRVAQIQALRRSGIEQRAEEILETALNLVGDGTPLTHRVILAMDASSMGRNDVVIALLKDRISYGRDSDALRLLLTAMINGRQWVGAQSLLSSLPESVRSVRWAQRANAVLQVNTGGADASALVDAYLRAWPSDLGMTLAKVRILQRKQDDAAIRQFLSGLTITNLIGSPEAVIQLAAAIAHYEDPKRGLSIAYTTLLNNWNEPDAHLAYQSLILSVDAVASAISRPEVVEIDTVVGVSGEGTSRRHRIESNHYRYFEDERQDPTGHLARLLLGHAPGESFPVDDRPDAPVIRVDWVKSIYLDAFHRSMDEFNERFPQADGLLKVKFDPEADDPLEHVRSVTQARAERDQALLLKYKAQELPLSFVAGLLGRDVLEAWHGLRSVNVPFYICRGTSDERERALEDIRRHGGRGCVVDAVTLSTIRRLDIADAVRSVCGPLHTTQSVLDLFAHRAVLKRSEVGKSSGFLAWQDGRLVFQEYTVEMLEEVARECEEESAWAIRETTPISAMPGKEIREEILNLLDIVGHSTFDPAFAAQGSGLLLLSDDYQFRVWAADEFAVPATWLQPVLMLARERGTIANPRYFDSINTLALSGHSYISLEAGALLKNASDGKFELTNDLARLLDQLGGPTADLSSNTSVMAEFVTRLTEASGSSLGTMRIVSDALRAMTISRPRDQRVIAALILRKFQGMARSWMPKIRARSWVPEHIVGWLIGHSIGEAYLAQLIEDQRRLLTRQ